MTTALCGLPKSVGLSDIPCLIRFFIDSLESLDMSISAINVRNQFKGKVKEIIRGPVVSEVDVDTPFGIVTSVITTRSVDELDLKVGSEVVALVKSTEVSIARL
jgi:molybdopterin-binding protein